MPTWKMEIKRLANDFCMSQVKINRMLKRVETEHSQREMPARYNGNRNDYLYDKAQREMMDMLYA